MTQSASEFGAFPARAGSVGAQTPDMISLRDHTLEIEIGAFQQERGRSQRVRFNIAVELVPFPGQRREDDVDSILSYDVLAQAIEDEIAGARVDLLETLAEGIAARILTHAAADCVCIRIEKLDRLSGALGVEMVRDRNTSRHLDASDSQPVPIIVFVSAEALDADLSDRIDALMKEGPAVLCVDALHTAAPQADHPRAQWRIDLLALEQCAWKLAARDERCVVVASRTELDWDIRQGRLAVWAPSKLVLDAREDAPELGSSAEMLAHWLATRLGASEMRRWTATGKIRVKVDG